MLARATRESSALIVGLSEWSRLCKNTLGCRLDCVHDGAGEDLAKFRESPRALMTSCDDVDELISARQQPQASMAAINPPTPLQRGPVQRFRFHHDAAHRIDEHGAARRGRRECHPSRQPATLRCRSSTQRLTTMQWRSSRIDRNSVDRPIPALGKDVQDLISRLPFRTGRSLHRSYISADR